MKIDSTTSIEAVLKIMRENGVEKFKLDGFEVEFSRMPGPAMLEPTPEDRRRAISELLKAEDDDHEANELWSVP